MKGKGKRTKVFVPKNKDLLLDREGTDMAHRKMAVYKATR